MSEPVTQTAEYRRAFAFLKISERKDLIKRLQSLEEYLKGNIKMTTVLTKRAFHGFGQAQLNCGGLVLGSSYVCYCPNCLKKIKLTSKVHLSGQK